MDEDSFFEIFQQENVKTAAVGGAIGGAVAGVIAGILIGLFLCCCMRMAASRSDDDAVYSDKNR